MLAIPGFGSIEASLVDAASPCVFVDAASLGCAGNAMPEDLERDPVLLGRMEQIRLAASVAMGIAPDTSAAAQLLGAPRVAMLAGPLSFATLSGRPVEAAQVDLTVRIISDGQPHRAVPLTSALCVAVASRIPGTIAHALARGREGAIRIGQPSGVTHVDAEVEFQAPDSAPRARTAVVYRTARRLFEGHVCFRPSALALPLP